MPVIDAILLAAGASRRMGQAKQLLPYRGSTLLAHAIETVLASQVRSLTVVLGASATTIRESIAHLPVNIVLNPNWEQGMSSSLVSGLPHIAPTAEGLLVCLGDQPHITTDWYNQLIASFPRAPHQLVSTTYQGKMGVPVVWGSAWFSQLSELTGQHGARNLLRQAASQAVQLPFPAAALDIDHPEDYQELLRQHDSD